MPEIDYSLGISNYTILFCLFALTSLLLDTYKINNNFSITKISKDNVTLFIFLLTSLLISKASTFPTFFFSFIFLLLHYYRRFFNSTSIKSLFQTFLLPLLIVIISFLSWIIPKSNHGSLAISNPFCFILDINSQCLNSTFNNPFTGWILQDDHKIQLLTNLPLFSHHNIIVFIYIWFISILPCFFLGTYLVKCSINPYVNIFGNLSRYYSISTALSVVFIRESTRLGGGHTAHSYYIACIFSLMCLSLIIYEFIPSSNYSSLILFPITLIIVLLFTYNNTNTSILSKRIVTMNLAKTKITNNVSLTIQENNYFDSSICTNSNVIRETFGLFLDDNGCGTNDLAEIKHSLDSTRSNVSINADNSFIKNWVIK
ncbi:hypothetical protein [Prochlorococcus marinus]|uniref:hypothetical protein n=1 Tax=Prochlorococcus marinus TaxID=1219 RepID=UPI0022B4CA37|nr:hypothetical protein [Prochlorococcus marinus]